MRQPTVSEATHDGDDGEVHGSSIASNPIAGEDPLTLLATA